MRQITILLLLFCMLYASMNAQDKKSFKSQFLEAEYFFLLGEFKEARFIYSELLREDPTNANLQFLIGACYLSGTLERSKSIPFLEKAVESVSPGYKEGSYKERDAPKESLFALARAYHIQDQLDRAINYYNIYHNVMKLKDPAEIDFVLKQVESCKLAETMLKNPQPYSFTLFNSEVNLSASNSNAVLSEADSMLLFMRERPFYTAIMMTRMEKGKWTEAEVINEQLGVDGSASVCSVSPDGRELYICISEPLGSDIYVSNFKRGKWGKARPLNENINTAYSETHASVSRDGRKMYFTSNRPGGEGAMDIYVSERKENDDWGPAVNMGKPVNSIYSEETPFISENGKVLFFSSMGHPTMGGFDVFYSSFLPSGNWSYPANLGYPVSTCDDDLFYCPLKEGRQAMFSGFMDKGDDVQKIYLVKLDTASKSENVALKGSIKLEDNLRELDSTFTVSIARTGSEKDTVIHIKPDAATGEYTAELEPGTYELSLNGKGYTQEKENIAVVEGLSVNEIRMESALTPEKVSSGEYLVIKNILFAFDDFSLDDPAKTELEKLYRAMQLHPQVYVQVTGHADSKGSEEYNLRLSAKRARSIVDYLVSKGISRERFISLGIGEAENIALNQNPDGSDNPEGRRLNRYAEIKLINNSDDHITIAPVEVPEHLRPKADMAYSVLLAQTENKEYIPSPIEETKIELTETDKARLFMTPEYNDKAKVVGILNVAIDNGYPDARIISMEERNELILSMTDLKDDSLAPFTIQIMALKNPVDLSSFKDLGEVSEYSGKDGFHRYITGFYLSREQALRAVQENYLSRFPDAFIIPLERYSGKKPGQASKPGSGKTYYSIQFSATRIPAEKNKFRELENVRVSFGEDGYYKYSEGLFDNRQEAEIELKRIRDLGFTDAFLKKLESP